MEPNHLTEPKLLTILNELIQQELIFHHPTRADFERMADAAFCEVGASGRRYSREEMLEELGKRQSKRAEEAWETRDFHCLEIAIDNYLLTYTLIQGTRVTRRASIWRRTIEGWKIVYHQGTMVDA
mgnify:CR=1 FL=1